MVLVRGGLVLIERVRMVRPSGQVVWGLPGAQRNTYRLGDYFVVELEGEPVGPQVAIEIASGRAFIRSPGSVPALGTLAAAPGRWFSVLDNPRRLVAWDLTDPAQ